MANTENFLKNKKMVPSSLSLELNEFRVPVVHFQSVFFSTKFCYSGEAKKGMRKPMKERKGDRKGETKRRKERRARGSLSPLQQELSASAVRVAMNKKVFSPLTSSTGPSVGRRHRNAYSPGVTATVCHQSVRLSALPADNASTRAPLRFITERGRKRN